MNEKQSDLPDRVRITEVGPRDGLQNEEKIISTRDKIRLIDALSLTGVDEIEVSSFVSPRWVPQLGDATAVFRGIKRNPDVIYSALVPNSKGLAGAVSSECRKIAVFTAATETFSQKNTNASIEQSLERIARVVEEAQFENISVRGYISCVIACPYEGKVDPQKVATIVTELRTLGVDEIDLGDTIGAATPESVEQLLNDIGVNSRTTVHLHDTEGLAEECVRKCLEMGVRSFDGSVAGLGGCPFAPGAPGNISTSALVKTIHEEGFITGVDPEVMEKAEAIARELIPTCES